MHRRAATSPPLIVLLLAGLAMMVAPVVRAASDFDFAHEVQRDFRMGLFPRQSSSLNLQVCPSVRVLCYAVLCYTHIQRPLT